MLKNFYSIHSPPPSFSPIIITVHSTIHLKLKSYVLHVRIQFHSCVSVVLICRSSESKTKVKSQSKLSTFPRRLTTKLRELKLLPFKGKATTQNLPFSLSTNAATFSCLCLLLQPIIWQKGKESASS